MPHRRPAPSVVRRRLALACLISAASCGGTTASLQASDGPAPAGVQLVSGASDGWIAREAVNRIEPLRDPGDRTEAPQRPPVATAPAPRPGDRATTARPPATRLAPRSSAPTETPASSSRRATDSPKLQVVKPEAAGSLVPLGAAPQLSNAPKLQPAPTSSSRRVESSQRTDQLVPKNKAADREASQPQPNETKFAEPNPVERLEPATKSVPSLELTPAADEPTLTDNFGPRNSARSAATAQSEMNETPLSLGDASQSSDLAEPDSTAASDLNAATKPEPTGSEALSSESADNELSLEPTPRTPSLPAAEDAMSLQPAELAPAESKPRIVRDVKLGRDGQLPGQAVTPAPTKSDAAPSLKPAKTEPNSLRRSNAGARNADPAPEQQSSDNSDSLSPVRVTNPLAIATRSEPTQSTTRAATPTEPREAMQPAEVRLDFTGLPTSGVTANRTVARLQPAMRSCMNYYLARPEKAAGRSNWGLLHSVMVYGIDTKVIVGPKTYSAIAWIAGNNVSRGQRIMQGKSGKLTARSGVGLQGHQAQLLAVLALTGVQKDYPLYADGKRFSVEDLVHAEAAACKSGEELTFSLIGLSHYLSTEESWTADDGETWDFERLIREELSQPVVGAACGGTHRLMGFAHALRMRRAEGLPITGQWARAQQFMDDFEEYAYRLQNRDGSMSTNWFEGRQDNRKMDRKVQTTGHIVEWLLTITPDDQLQDPRLVRSIQYLISAMHNQRSNDWAIGPKGHALRSIALYHERVFASAAWGSSKGSSNQVARLTTESLR